MVSPSPLSGVVVAALPTHVHATHLTVELRDDGTTAMQCRYELLDANNNVVAVQFMGEPVDAVVLAAVQAALPALTAAYATPLGLAVK